MSSPVTRPQYRIVILSGPDKGTAYQLVSSEVSIGREKDNDIVIAEDARLSRHHARVEIVGDQIEVVDLSQKNKIAVGQNRLERVRLKEGMTFTIGATEMKLERLSSYEPNQTAQNPAPDTSAPPLSIVPPPHVADRRPHIPAPGANPYVPGHFGGSPPPPTPGLARPRRAPKKKANYTLYVVVGLILIGLYIFTNPKVLSKKGSDIRSNEDIETTIQESQRAKEELRKRNQKLGDNYQESQALYIQGFRDYKKGQYARAIESFRAATSVFPDHQLAQRYLKLARRRLDEQIQFNMIQGRQFRARQMYDRCVFSFNTVLTLSADRNSPSYKEARELKEECQLKLEGRY